MKKAIFLSIIIIFSLISFPQVRAAPTYDFEADGIGAVPAGWLDTSSGACSARVSNDVAHGGTKSVKFIDSNNNGWSRLDIQNLFDESEITYYIYMFDTNRILYIYTYEGTIAGNDRLALVGFESDGDLYAFNIGVKTSLLSYVKEQWYKIRIMMDFGTNTFDVYVDDVLEANNYGFFDGGATNFKSCRFVTGKTLNSGVMGYVDDVWIGEVTYPPPSDPDLLFGAGFNASSPYVELHWNHSLVNVYYFEVQNSSDGITWDYLGNTTTANYTDTQVVNGTERYYRVRANNFTGGAWWNSSFTDVNFEKVYFEIISVNRTIQQLNGTWIHYNLTAITNITGIHDDGNLASTYFIDGDTWNCSEVVGVPGYVVNFNATGIDTNAIALWFVSYVHYDGNLAHEVNVELWNFSSNAFVEIGEIPDMLDFEWMNFTIYGLRVPLDFVNSTGALVGRLYHADAGNINHDIFIERINILAFVPTGLAVGIGGGGAIGLIMLILICSPLILLLIVWWLRKR